MNKPPTHGKAAFTTALEALNAIGADVHDAEWSDDLDTGRFVVVTKPNLTYWVFTIDGERLHALNNNFDESGEFATDPSDAMSIEIINPGPPTLARVLLALI